MIKLEKGKFNIVFGGQAGSEGKGKIACYIAKDNLEQDSNIVFACNHMPNAGHTFRDEDFKYVAGQLPTPAVFNNHKYGYHVPVVIGPGSAINIEFLEKEIEICCLIPGLNLFIHPNAGIVTEDHLKTEGGCLDNVSSTKKGGGACIAEKVMRQGKNGKHAIARDLLPDHLKPALADTSILLNNYMSAGWSVLYEGAQGFDLDINHGLEYPYVTSRMSNVSQALADSGVAPSKIGRRVMAIRPYPIRVGNAYDSDGKLLGTSGEYSLDNEELDWDKIRELCNAPDDVSLVERTTVTNKIRRVFTFSDHRYKKSLMVNDPTDIVITFLDHVNYKYYEKRGSFSDLDGGDRSEILNFLLDNNISIDKIRLFSTGPDNDDMITLN